MRRARRSTNPEPRNPAATPCGARAAPWRACRNAGGAGPGWAQSTCVISSRPRRWCAMSARSQPGERVHLDIKPLARIRRVGHRMHGDRSREVHGARVRLRRHRSLQPRGLCQSARGADWRRHHRLLARTLRWFARRARRRAPAPEPALSPPNQWQGRALHSNAHAPVGLCRLLSQLLAPHPRAPPLAPPLQPRAAPRRTEYHPPCVSFPRLAQ